VSPTALAKAVLQHNHITAPMDLSGWRLVHFEERPLFALRLAMQKRS
jgi:hypothetical protein